MVCLTTLAAAHNVAGGETTCLIYQSTILERKFPRTWLLCAAKEGQKKRAIPKNRPFGSVPETRHAE